MKYYVTINDKKYEVEVEKGEAAIVSTTEVAMGAMEKQAIAAEIAPETIKAPEQTKSPGEVLEGEVVKAPMAGGITDIKVSVGSAVKIGDTLLLLEAMKMENEITAHVDGIVIEIMVAKGAAVVLDEVLVVLSKNF